MKKNFRGLWINIIFIFLFLGTAVVRVITQITKDFTQIQSLVNLFLIIMLVFFGFRFLVAYFKCIVVKDNELIITGIFLTKKIKFINIKEFNFDDVLLSINLNNGKTVRFNLLNLPINQRNEFEKTINEKIINKK